MKSVDGRLRQRFASRLITPFYVVQLGGKLVMKLKKERIFLVDTYTLQAVEPFTDADEKLLLPSVALTIVYERQRLKTCTSKNYLFRR